MRIVRLKEVMGITGLGRSTIYRLMNEDRFPKSLDLGVRSIGWLEEDLNSWVQSKIDDRDKPK